MENDRKKLENIIYGVGMSLRPEFFAGRGANTSDLNHKRLHGIWLGIKDTISDTAADSFVQMVSKIEVISATTFLQELYALCDNDWQLDEHHEDAPGIVIQKDNNGNHMVAHGIMAMSAAMSIAEAEIDQTQEIKAWFLKCRGVPPKGRTYDKMGNSTKIW